MTARTNGRVRVHRGAKAVAAGKRVPAWVLLVGWTGMVALPLYVMVVSCFKSTNQIYDSPLALPDSWRLDNFKNAWQQANFDTYLLNSMLVTVAAVLLTIAVSALAAYPLSRYRLWWATPLLGFFLGGIMVPIRLASVEMFTLMRDLELIDSRTGLIFIYTAIRIPFAVFIFANFLRALPREMDEAARLDGAPEWRLLVQILLPQIRPAIAIVAIFTAIAVWNDFYFPLLFIFDEDLKTLPLGITTFVGQYRTDWGMLFAGLTMSLVPLFVLYLFTSRQIRQGIGIGGLR